MPRILVTLTSYPPAVGGAQINSHLLNRHLVESGFDVRVATQWSEDRRDWLLGTTVMAPPSRQPYTLDGVPVHRLGIDRSERLRLAPRAAAFYPCQGWAIRGIAQVLLPKLEAVSQGVDLVENVRIGREPLSFASWRLAQELEVPFVLRPNHHPRWRGYRYRHFLDLYRKAEGILALTDWERDELVRLGVARDRIQVTGVGPVLSDSSDGREFRRRHGLGDAPLVLFLGQKYDYKGVAQLLEAMPRVWAEQPRCRLLLIGPPTAHSRRLLSKGLDERVLELETVDLQEKTDAIAASSMLCVPSSQESFGLVYVEAWTLGRPVIGGPAPAVQRVIEDGRDGLLVDQDPADIARAILRLLDEPELGDEMGAAGQRKVERLYNWPLLARQVAGFYDRLIAGSGR